ncbi:hypothetical protein OROGR_014896 [Orobanche gracilis]
MEKQRKLHAIMIAIPYQGHMTPSVYLALRLASRGITVTFVNLEAAHRRLAMAHHGDDSADFDPFVEPRAAGLDIRYTTITDGLDPIGYDRDLNFEEYWAMLNAEFTTQVDEFVGNTILAEQDLVHLMVTDTVFVWPAEVCEKHNIVNVSYWTQPALVFALNYHFDLLKDHGHYMFSGEIDEEITYLPGIKSISTKDLTSVMKEPGELRIINSTTITAFDKVKKADFILQNTVEELESEVLSALNKYQPNYAIGPVRFSKNLPFAAITTSLRPVSDCTEWLDSKPPVSVLYVSLGSFVNTNKELLTELAHGLLLSEVSFLWVIREGILGDVDADVLLSQGYREELKDRGLIIPWGNQVKILSNPAIGGFLTHNGWNSTVESIWCGIPMICFPMLFDQPTNRKLVVDEWKVGINLCDGAVVDRVEVTKKIKRFMREDVSQRLRQQQIGKVRKTMQKALDEGGSSEANLDRFMADLKARTKGVTEV